MKKSLLGLIVTSVSFVSFTSGDIFNILPIHNDSEPHTVDVTFNAGDGVFNDGSKIKVFSVRYNVSYADLIKGEEIPYDPTYKTIPFQCWETDDQNKSTINSTYKFTKSTQLLAKYGSSKFSEDTWENLVGYANSKDNKGVYIGFDKLKEKYSADYKSDKGKKANTFVGLTRYVKYGDNDYKVRVIDETKDEVTGGIETDRAALTFEFVEAPTDAPYQTFSTTVNNTYSTSYLKQFLNNTFKNNLESSVKDNLVSVKKRTYQGNGASKTTTVNSDETVFALSLSEMNILTDIHGNTDIANENTTYAYYNNDNNNKVSDRIKYQSGKPVIYWLRSPDNGTSFKDRSSCIYSDGNLGKKTKLDAYINQEVYYTAAVAPAFCIGQQRVELASFEDDEWSNIIYYANQGSNALHNRYKKDYESSSKEKEKKANTMVGLTHELKIQNWNKSKSDTYHVRVIGENHDDICTDNVGPNPNAQKTDKKASLTFELVEVYDKTTVWDSDNVTADDDNQEFKKYARAKSFNTSVLNTTLNNVSQLDNYNTIYSRIDPIVKNNIKTVAKDITGCWERYNDDWGAAKTKDRWKTYKNWFGHEFACKLFPLSFWECGGNSGAPYDSETVVVWDWFKTHTETEWLACSEYLPVSAEGSAYEYYKPIDTIIKQEYSSGFVNRKRQKQDINGVNRKYYLRTSWIRRELEFIYLIIPVVNWNFVTRVDEGGRIASNGHYQVDGVEHSNNEYISFAFCI